jgi:hypothetical protein
VVELFSQAAGGDPAAISGAAALVSMLALVPAALIFVINQLLQNTQLREEKYRYLHDQYMAFLRIVLDHPEFDLEHGDGHRFSGLDECQKRQLYVVFELFTAMLEAAFKLYERSYTSNKKTQWQGWISYAKRYLSRPDYQHFLSSTLFRDDVCEAVAAGRGEELIGRSEYDIRFERFLLRQLGDLLADRTLNAAEGRQGIN